MAKEYDYLLKVLLVGDSDVGKTEILSNLDEDPMNEEGEKKNKKQFLSKSLISHPSNIRFSNIQDYNHFARREASEATGKLSNPRTFFHHAIYRNAETRQKFISQLNNSRRSGMRVAKVAFAQ